MTSSMRGSFFFKHACRSPLTALLVISLLGALIIGITGCQEESRTYPTHTRTKGKAQLPPTPNLSPKPPLSKYEDGALSVYGLLNSGPHKRETLLTVRGFVAAIHVCSAEQKICKPAPYVQLTDSEKLQGQRLLVGGAIDPARDGLKIGARADLKGHFATSSPDGLYFAPQGLLLFEPPAPPSDGAEETDKGGVPVKPIH